ncbi:MAG: entericidin [Phycisphaeraceae bacterium]|nr:entericidin [Phycisphaeraceae bacterium]MCW5753996.1 entericidin [Phycisphaeraceae bacterium]
MPRTRTIARSVLVLTVAAAACVLASCNTVKGVGKDLQEASEATERAISG